MLEVWLIFCDFSEPTLTLHWLKLVVLCKNYLSGNMSEGFFFLCVCVCARTMSLNVACVCVLPLAFILCKHESLSPMIQLCARGHVVLFFWAVLLRRFKYQNCKLDWAPPPAPPPQDPSSCLPGYVAPHAQFHCQQTWNKERKKNSPCVTKPSARWSSTSFKVHKRRVSCWSCEPQQWYTV